MADIRYTREELDALAVDMERSYRRDLGYHPHMKWSEWDRLLLTARAGAEATEDAARLDWLDENVDCAEDDTWREWIDRKRTSSGRVEDAGGPR